MVKQLLPLLFLSGCLFLDPFFYPEIHEQRQRYQYEYDLDGEHGKQHGYTDTHHMKVYFPRWMTNEDRQGFIDMVDSYANQMIEAYPKIESYEWSKIWVYAHDAVDVKIMSGGHWPIWCHGWRHGRVVYCPWRPILEEGERVDVAEERCLPVLPHEITHILSEWETGQSDPNHETYFQREEIKNMIASARRNALGCKLSDESKARALQYTYEPWYQED